MINRLSFKFKYTQICEALASDFPFKVNIISNQNLSKNFK